jgi:murein DD-endopeptidase MepM/ murein hydrolase activator NlpD
LAIVAAGTVATCLPVTAHAYCWPLRPFDRPHAIRGGFDDPRLHVDLEGVQTLASFHFGVDIAARDGTPVYAVGAGRVTVHPDSVVLRRPDGRVFGYWHVAAAVATAQHVRLHQLLGYVHGGWEHLHFAESRRGVYLDPLRRGALTPFRDRTAPAVETIRLVDAHGDPVRDASRAAGVVADIFDTPPLAPPSPWELARLAPAMIRWRLVRDGKPRSAWRVVDDFARLVPAPLFDWIYAPGTAQNKPDHPGRYVYWITHSLDAWRLPPGRYSVQVEASDTRGNVGRDSLAFTLGRA